jgi:hypothetical protein
VIQQPKPNPWQLLLLFIRYEAGAFRCLTVLVSRETAKLPIDPKALCSILRAVQNDALRKCENKYICSRTRFGAGMRVPTDEPWVAVDFLLVMLSLPVLVISVMPL